MSAKDELKKVVEQYIADGGDMQGLEVFDDAAYPLPVQVLEDLLYDQQFVQEVDEFIGGISLVDMTANGFWWTWQAYCMMYGLENRL